MSKIKSVCLEKNQRKHIREALAAKTLSTAIIPLGSTEQHNEHLAIEQDTAGIKHIANLVAEKLFPKAIVTPVISVGSSPHHMLHPGTLSLQPKTLALVIHDVVESLAQHGFKYIVVLNGHGGNVRALDQHMKSIKPPSNIEFLFCSFWDVVDEDFVENNFPKATIFPGHAGIVETSIALSAFPENVDMSASYPNSLFKNDDPGYERDHLLFEESRQASVKIGEALIQHVVEKLVKKLNRWIASAHK